MKKILSIILVLATLLSLAGCGVADNDSGNAPDNVELIGSGDNEAVDVTTPTDEPLDKTSSDESTSSDTDSSDITSVYHDCMVRSPQKENKKIKKIVDESHKYLKTGNIVMFYEEKEEIYGGYFTVSGESDGIIIYFEDGTTMGVVEAFKKKLVKLSDLDKFGVKYINNIAGLDIFDLTETYDCNVKKGKQEFYRDKNFSYFFPSQKDDYVKYVDKNGKTILASEALKAGKIKLSDLGNWGVDFDKKYLGDKVLIVNESEGYPTTDMVTEFFRDETYVYSFSSGKCVWVYYPDGTGESVTKALEKGKIKISDLDKFDIDYWGESIEDKKKEIYIVDLTEYRNYPVDDAEEEFYRDDKYVYLFPTQKSKYVMVALYWYNEDMTAKEALAKGKIDIDSVLKEMDKQKIAYIKRPISEN
jgi:hypothetical protein